LAGHNCTLESGAEVVHGAGQARGGAVRAVVPRHTHACVRRRGPGRAGFVIRADYGAALVGAVPTRRAQCTRCSGPVHDPGEPRVAHAGGDSVGGLRRRAVARTRSAKVGREGRSIIAGKAGTGWACDTPVVSDGLEVSLGAEMALSGKVEAVPCHAYTLRDRRVRRREQLGAVRRAMHTSARGRHGGVTTVLADRAQYAVSFSDPVLVPSRLAREASACAGHALVTTDARAVLDRGAASGRDTVLRAQAAVRAVVREAVRLTALAGVGAGSGMRQAADVAWRALLARRGAGDGLVKAFQACAIKNTPLKFKLYRIHWTSLCFYVSFWSSCSCSCSFNPVLAGHSEDIP